jgi:hypothetical protein
MTQRLDLALLDVAPDLGTTARIESGGLHQTVHEDVDDRITGDDGPRC